MQFTFTLIAAIACITTGCNAISLNLFPQAGCPAGVSRASCSNPGYADCCTGGAPFCQSGDCDGCVVGNDIYTFNFAGCTGNAYAYCRAAVGNGCCLPAGGGNTCAVVAYVGAGISQRAVDAEECEATIRPNHLVYTDHNGTEHEIYIPTGSFDTVAQHFINADWNALSSFPAWNNQSYTEADRVRKVKRTN